MKRLVQAALVLSLVAAVGCATTPTVPRTGDIFQDAPAAIENV